MTNELNGTTNANITVLDAIMGSGKTSWAIDYMNEAHDDQRFIYITPFLSEVDRVKNNVKNREFKAPLEKGKDSQYKTKLEQLKELVVNGENVVSTHSLFSNADDELIELLEDAGYTLILDEVMNVIESVSVSKDDRQTLLDAGLVEIRGNEVKWVNDDHNGGRFDDIKQLANAGNLYIHRNMFLLWTFPAKIFRAFDEVYILTYLFDAQLQRSYYDYYGIEYGYKSVKWNGEKYELTEYDRANENRGELMDLIDLYDGKLNDVGDRKNALSSSWLRNAGKKKTDQLAKNLYTFFRNQCGARQSDVIWTTLKDAKNKLKPRGFKSEKIFVPFNTRATNEYGEKWALAYVYNRFLRPHERVFFEDNGITVDQDLLAVSDLLQWIWRSRIRNGEPIKLYLPSSRMRKLFKAWANYEI